MGIIRTLFGSLEPEHRSEFAQAIRPGNYASASDVSPYSAGDELVVVERRATTRNIDDFVVMCRTILSESHAYESSGQFLMDWIKFNYQSKDSWPGSMLFERLSRAIAGLPLDAHEEAELLDILTKVPGSLPSAAFPGTAKIVPVDDPIPAVVYRGSRFALTGQFIYGTRKRVEAVIENKGGTLSRSVNTKCRYLVVGTFISDEWQHSDHESKLAEALRLKAEGIEIYIVSERHWVESLDA